MENDTRQKKRAASSDEIPETERVKTKKRRPATGDGAKKRPADPERAAKRRAADADGTTKRRTSDPERAAKRRAADADGTPMRRSRAADADQVDRAERSSSRKKNYIPLPTESKDPDFDQERRDRARRRKKAEMRRKRMMRKRLIVIAACAAVLILLCIGITAIVRSRKASGDKTSQDAAVTQDGGEITMTESTQIPTESSLSDTVVAPASVTDKAVEITPEYQEIDFNPTCTDATDPSNLIEYTGVSVNGEEIEDRDSYAPFLDGEFGVGSAYTDVDGIISFRGNNFRDDPTRGVVGKLTGSMNIAWTRQTGSLESSGHTWSGNGWTGQPLMIRWPSDVKQHMNMYDSAKANDDLIEVIYASMDGNIYFIDFETGELTRDTMSLGYTFKGAGALDPRGYPIMYVGSGYNSAEGTSRVFVINLLDCSVMYTFGNDDSFALRNLSFFDSSALVDAETDTLIYPGENGVLYLIHLNTQYDAANGTLSIDPDNIIKWHYWGTRSSDENFWLGMEDSCCIYKGYFFACDNGGILWCLNLKTLRVVWAQDILDDSNGSPALSIEDGHLYLYVSTSFHLGWRSESTATVPIWKIDAENGEIVWQTDYTCYSESGVSGGVQSTPAIGRNQLGDYVYVTVARTGDEYGGVLTCLNKKTGEIVWEHSAVYTWSSPVCVYDADGTGTVIYFTFDGKGYMLDGVTGDVKGEIQLPTECVEASPAIYNNRLVVGTRDCEIYGIDLG